MSPERASRPASASPVRQPYGRRVNDPDLATFADTPWPTVNHRAALERLETLGWTKCGEGDWAIVLRSPGGRLAARISAFEPSYEWFVELCKRCDGNPYFPRIEFVSELEGGGHLAALEYLRQVGEDEETEFLERWKDEAEPDPALRGARAATEALDRECRAKVRFWMGIDLGSHVMRAADGQVKLVDLLGVGGGLVTEQIHADMERDRLAAAFAAYDRTT
jgi:hypothetical protein